MDRGVKMPNLKSSDLRPFIPARDFEVSKRFYESLGWKVEDLGHGLALVTLGTEHFYIQNYYNKAVAENSMLHLTVQDAQAWYEHAASVITDSRPGGPRVQPPRRQPYGALVTFVHDPTGVLLHLCQWDK